MHIGDDVAVGSVVLASLAYAVLALGPKTLKSRWLRALASLMERLPNGLKPRSLTARLEAAAARRSGSCGGCSNCGSEAPTAAPAPAEVRIPLGAIGRRDSTHY